MTNPDPTTQNLSSDKNQSVEASKTKSVEEKILFTWKAPARMFKRRSREFWTKIGVVGTLFGVILYISEGVMPVILLISVFFLFYILSTIEPEDIEFRISTLGVYIDKDRINFSQIFRYWFTKDEQRNLLNFETSSIPGRFAVVVNKNDEEKIRASLQKYIPEETPEATQADRLTDWVAQKLQ